MFEKLLNKFRNVHNYVAPIDSIPVGNDINGIPYMSVWKNDLNRICFEFRNPNPVVMFDKSVLPELILALSKIQNDEQSS